MPGSRRIAGLNRWLVAFVFGVVRRPRLTVLLAVAGVGVSATVAWLRLDMSTDQDQLFSTKVPFFHDYVEFTKAFPENQAGYVIVQARHVDRPPPVGQWTRAADAITARLAADHENVRSVEGPVSPRDAGPQALLFTDDPTEVAARRKEVAAQLVPLAQRWGEAPGFGYSRLGPSPLQRFVAAGTLAPADDFKQLGPFLGILADGWSKAIDAPRRPVTLGDQVPDLADLEATNPRDKGYSYIVDPDPDPARAGQHLLLIKFFPQDRNNSKDGLIRTIAAIRAEVRAAAAPFADQLAVGLSGRSVLDADELETTDRDARKAEIVALTAVFVGMAIFLRSIWLAVAAEIALVIGIGWTFGWATVATMAYNRAPRGDLNLLSMVFLIALIGIGMDYLIQVLTRYRQEAVRYADDPGRDPRSIWAGVFKHVAAPINTACAGAGGAFLVSVFTPFRGAAELGLIAGGGLLLCLLTGYVVLPALLTWFPAKVRPTAAERAAAHGLPAPDADAAGPRSTRVRWLALPTLWAALLLAGLPFMRRTGFDPGLITLQAQNLESVQLIHKLPTWFDVELSTDLDVLRRVRTEVAKLKTVSGTFSVLDAVEADAYLRANPLPAVRWTTLTPVAAADLPGIADSAERVADRLSSTPSTDSAATASSAAALRAFATKARAAAGWATADLAARQLTQWQATFVDELHALLAPFYPASPPDVRTAPPAVRDHLLGTDGRYALYINPAKDCWDQKNLAEFVDTVEAAVKAVPNAPPVTGVASDVYHSTDQTHAAFRDATLYALGLIFLLVLLDLRNLGQTLLAISVLALGLPMLVAVMGVLHINWNFANFFGLPILIGAGHEYGVFMVHRYNEACRDAHRPWRKWDVSDRALLLCGYVTSISFGFFWLFGHHLGLKSLGLVMALGIACIYAATVCVLRPLLLWKLAARDGCATSPASPPRIALGTG